MIATELGVTKAAVYYHYPAKEDIVRAVLAPAFGGFQVLLDEAAAVPQERRAGDLVDGLARQAVTHRELYAVVLQDVTAAQLRRESPDHRDVFRRLRDTLAGPSPDADRLIRAAVFLSGLMGPAVDPDVARLDDHALERAIARAGRGALGLEV
jgi:AcrR family transcriptional regulator